MLGLDGYEAPNKIRSWPLAATRRVSTSYPLKPRQVVAPHLTLSSEIASLVDDPASNLALCVWNIRASCVAY